jgi:regulatory protein
MPIITKLERQKHDNSRVSVFVDGEYSFSVTDEIIIEYGIAQGKDPSLLPLQDIMAEDEYKRCLSAAFKHAAVSEKTEKQMRDFLTKKEYSLKSVDRVISRLKELDYINDLSYAKNFVEHSAHTGIRALRYKLKTKGISEADILTALENETEEAQEEKALKIAEKQLPKYQKHPVFEQKRRLNAYLLNHGFDYEISKQVIDKLLSEED